MRECRLPGIEQIWAPSLTVILGSSLLDDGRHPLDIELVNRAPRMALGLPQRFYRRVRPFA